MKNQQRGEKEISRVSSKNHNQETETDVDRILLVDFAVGIRSSNFFEVSSSNFVVVAEHLLTKDRRLYFNLKEG